MYILCINLFFHFYKLKTKLDFLDLEILTIDKNYITYVNFYENLGNLSYLIHKEGKTFF